MLGLFEPGSVLVVAVGSYLVWSQKDFSRPEFKDVDRTIAWISAGRTDRDHRGPKLTIMSLGTVAVSVSLFVIHGLCCTRYRPDRRPRQEPWFLVGITRLDTVEMLEPKWNGPRWFFQRPVSIANRPGRKKTGSYAQMIADG